MAKTILTNEHLNERSLMHLFRSVRRPDRNAIKKVHMVPTGANICKIYSYNNAVFANCNFYPNDIVEICPTQSIDKSSLYSSDVRRIVFEVIKNEQFVIPFGYCQFYGLADELTEPNCTYIWDPNTKVIVIKALKRIQKGDKLILKA